VSGGPDALSRSADAVVVGAGIVGAACAYELAEAGLEVCVLDRGALACGTSGRCEGNILLSDKVPGPELDLAQASVRAWLALGERLEDDFELERKGGLLCAADPEAFSEITELAARHADAGVESEVVQGPALWELEPALHRGQLGGTFYPGDLQVQPMRAAAALLHHARRRGARLCTGTEVLAIVRDSVGSGGSVIGLETSAGQISTPAVINAAGPWAAQLASLAGARLPVAPRRGVILVTEPVGPLVHHKVYAAKYVSDVHSGEGSLNVSAVVEGTPSGPILIGASRELVGFDTRVPSGVLGRLADAALALFPSLAGVRVIRSYTGFRPFSPDHLPVIGPDPSVPGLWHACGHEGAGICLAPVSGQLVRAAVTGTAPPVDPAPFRPGRDTLEQPLAA
jgi:glycine/D-amino acid oxidase-like deaminating enzyme